MTRSLALLVLALAAPAHAASHAINIAPVRGFVKSHLVDAKTKQLKLGKTLDATKLPAGISAVAIAKASQTANGMKGFNSGRTVGNHVVQMGSEKLIVTAMEKPQKIDGIAYESANPGQLFVVRTGAKGLVIARGQLDHVTGALTFTRSHNEHAASTPAERNAGK